MEKVGPVAGLVLAFNAAEANNSLPVRFHVGYGAYGPATIGHLRRKGFQVRRGTDCWEITSRDL